MKKEASTKEANEGAESFDGEATQAVEGVFGEIHGHSVDQDFEKTCIDEGQSVLHETCHDADKLSIGTESEDEAEC